MAKVKEGWNVSVEPIEFKHLVTKRDDTVYNDGFGLRSTHLALNLFLHETVTTTQACGIALGLIAIILMVFG